VSPPIHVFLGPTVTRREAELVLPACYHPPVAMGDIWWLVTDSRPVVIAIVDGTFQSTPAVWHKEILFALSLGVRVVGAASMGALRAAELHTLGMEGSGAIFEAFRDGRIEDDDEVAVAHADAALGFRPLSDAMVNLRAGLRAARDHGILTQAAEAELVRQAKERFYPERTWASVFDAARRLGLAVDALIAFVRERRPDAKREDALEMLRGLAAARPPPRPPVFEPTAFWDRMVTAERARRDPAE
jgi:hypothetical protein